MIMSLGALWAWHGTAIEEEMLGAPTVTPQDVGELPSHFFFSSGIQAHKYSRIPKKKS